MFIDIKRIGLVIHLAVAIIMTIRIYFLILVGLASIATNVYAETTPSADIQNSSLNHHRVTISEIGVSINLPPSWPARFNIVAGTPSSMTSSSPFTINMRRNGGGNEPGTFSVMSITMFDFTKSDRYGSLFQDGKLIGAEMYSSYMQKPGHETIEFRELDDGSNALMYGRNMLNLNHAPFTKTLPGIHIPNSIGLVGKRRVGNYEYTSYEITSVNKGKMAIIVMAVPVSEFSALKSELDEISQGVAYIQ